MAAIRYYTDEHIHRTIAYQLQQRGIDVLRCQDAGMLEAKDSEHLLLATAQGRVMVTGDADFLILDAEYRAKGEQHAGIVYITSNKLGDLGAIIQYLAFLHDAIEGGAADLETDVYNRVLRV